MSSPEFEAIYAELRARMLRAAAGLTVATDAPGHFVLHARIPNPSRPKEAMWFGSVQVKKGYVSYHLLPAYTHPALKDPLSDALKKRMQGLACFNFKRADPALFDELEALTATGARLYETPFELQRAPGD